MDSLWEKKILTSRVMPVFKHHMETVLAKYLQKPFELGPLYLEC